MRCCVGFCLARFLFPLKLKALECKEHLNKPFIGIFEVFYCQQTTLFSASLNDSASCIKSAVWADSVRNAWFAAVGAVRNILWFFSMVCASWVFASIWRAVAWYCHSLISLKNYALLIQKERFFWKLKNYLLMSKSAKGKWTTGDCPGESFALESSCRNFLIWSRSGHLPLLHSAKRGAWRSVASRISLLRS